MNYTKNLEKQKGIFNNLSYEELMSLILSFSKFRDVDNSNEFLWKKAITNTFWNEYLNFLEEWVSLRRLLFIFSNSEKSLFFLT